MKREKLIKAVNQSNFLLKIQSAQLYGLMTGNPNNINQEKCIKMIERGKRNNIVPDEDFIMLELFDPIKYCTHHWRETKKGIECLICKEFRTIKKSPTTNLNTERK